MKMMSLQSVYRNVLLLIFAVIISNYILLVNAFAAKSRRGGGGKRPASGNKGFQKTGPPQELELAKRFKTRMPDNPDSEPCPCQSGLLYKSCCGPYHRKELLPDSPMAVLRSRYSAFCWRLPLYIMDTTHYSCRDYRKDRVTWIKEMDKQGMFDSFDFCSLQAGPEELTSEREGFIEFTVGMRKKNGSSEDVVVKERSRFVLDGDPPRWSYASGDIRSTYEGLEDLKLN